MTTTPTAPGWIDGLARWIGQRAAGLGRASLLARLDGAAGHLVTQARDSAASRTDALRKADPKTSTAHGRTVEGIVVAWLVFTLGTAVAEMPAASGCVLQGLRVWFGFPPPGCATETADGIGLVWLGKCALASGLFYIVGRWAFAVADDITDSKARMVAEHEWRARVLIVGLSTTNGTAEAQIAQALEQAPRWKAFTGSHQKDSPSGGNWQQSARVIGHHLSTLEAIYLLPSGDTLQLKEVDAFRRYCRALFSRDIPIHEIKGKTGEPFAIDGEDGPVRDYENYDYVYAGLRTGVDQALKEIPNLTEADICVDVTPGQKIFSIAAGIITLNRGLRFCYVTTGQIIDRSGRVFVYDAQLSGFGSLAKAAKAGVE